MRIAFAGPSGTGKTTLATWVSETYNVPINPIGARSVAAAMGFASPYGVDAAGKRGVFQRRLLADKLAWEAEHDVFVTDRTPLDNLTYTMLHDVSAIDAAQLKAVEHGCDRYTHVIQCSLDAFHCIGDDPARVADPTYHVLYEIVLEGLIARYIPLRRLSIPNASDLDTRKDQVRMALLEG